MNYYRVTIRFACRGFHASTYEYFEAATVGQAVTKGLRRFEQDKALPEPRELSYLSAVFVRKQC